MASVFPMRFVALVALVTVASLVTLVTVASLVTLVSFVSAVSPCYLVHQNGGFSWGTSYARNGLLIMQFKSRLLPSPPLEKGKGGPWKPPGLPCPTPCQGAPAPCHPPLPLIWARESPPSSPPRGCRAESPRLCAPWNPALLNF